LNSKSNTTAQSSEISEWKSNWNCEPSHIPNDDDGDGGDGDEDDGSDGGDGDEDDDSDGGDVPMEMEL